MTKFSLLCAAQQVYLVQAEQNPSKKQAKVSRSEVQMWPYFGLLRHLGSDEEERPTMPFYPTPEWVPDDTPLKTRLRPAIPSVPAPMFMTWHVILRKVTCLDTHIPSQIWNLRRQ